MADVYSTPELLSRVNLAFTSRRRVTARTHVATGRALIGLPSGGPWVLSPPVLFSTERFLAAAHAHRRATSWSHGTSAPATSRTALVGPLPGKPSTEGARTWIGVAVSLCPQALTVALWCILANKLGPLVI